MASRFRAGRHISAPSLAWLLRDEGADILSAIRTEKSLSEATEKKLVEFLDKFAKGFSAE
jgi:hypothetical protein